MKKNYNIVVSKFNFDKLSIKDLYMLLNRYEYSNENGFGFRNMVFESKILSATLLKKTQTFINEYNVENDAFERKTIALYKEVDFIINYATNTLSVFGSASNSNKLKSIFRNVFSDLEYLLTNLDLTSFNIYQKLKSNNQFSDYKIEELTIRNFKYKDGASGRYVTKILNQTIAGELLDTYQNDVVKIKVLFEEKFNLSLQNNGAYTMSCNEDEIIENINFINNLIV